MKPLPTPEALAVALVRPHRDCALVPLSSLQRVRVAALSAVFGRAVSQRLTGQTGGAVAVRKVLARAALAQRTETIHSAAHRRGMSVRTLHQILCGAGVIKARPNPKGPGQAKGGRWHRVPSEAIDRALARHDARQWKHCVHAALRRTCVCGAPKSTVATHCRGCYLPRFLQRAARRTLSPAVVRRIYTAPRPFAEGARCGVPGAAVTRIVQRRSYRDVTEGLTRTWSPRQAATS